MFMRCVAVVASLCALSGSALGQCEPPLLGSLAGNITDIARVGDLVYAANYGGGMIIYDVSDAAHPLRLGELRTTELITAIAVRDDFALLTSAGRWESGDEGSGLLVVDISDPSEPVLVSRTPLGGAKSDIALQGEYGFVIDQGSPVQTDLSVIDLADPAVPQLVSTVTNGPYGRDSTSIAVHGDHAYVTDIRGRLLIYDISDELSPQYIGLRSVQSPLHVVVSDDNSVAYVASAQGRIAVFDLSDPSNPVQVALSPFVSGSINGITLDSDRLYTLGASQGMLDVSNPSQPQVLRSPFSIGAFTRRGLFENGHGVVAGTYRGLLTVDYSAVASPVVIGEVSELGNNQDIELIGDATYVNSTVTFGAAPQTRIVDRTDPTFPVLVGELPSGRLVVEGLRATVGVSVYDVSDPFDPLPVGSIAGLPGVVDGTIDDTYGYYINSTILYVVDFSDPGAASVFSQLSVGSSARLVAARGPLAAVVHRNQDGFQRTISLVDVSSPATPTVVGSIELVNDIADVEFANLSTLVAYTRDSSNSSATIAAIIVTNPQDPELVGSYEFSSFQTSISMFNGMVVLTNGQGEIQLLDVGQPATPTIVRSIHVPTTNRSVILQNDRAHVSSILHGYLVFDLSNCQPLPGCMGDIADDFGFTAADGGGPDGFVDFGDFVALLGLIGPCAGGVPGCLGDIADDFGFTTSDGGGPDGVVDFGDFVALLGLIGPCP